jgi:hypothetical protein
MVVGGGGIGFYKTKKINLNLGEFFVFYFIPPFVFVI